ncbi:hypothetical protein ACM66B_002948 [Microbotryomycetes sp. NB124-2]
MDQQSQLFDDSQQQTQTQPQTQQVASQSLQPTPPAFPPHLWGILTSVTGTGSANDTHDALDKHVISPDARDRPATFEFDRSKLEIKVGRHPKADLQLKGAKISSWHARIWLDTQANTVILEDSSSNGTFVRNVRVGKGNKTIIEPGDQIIFGPISEDWAADFRYTFQGPSARNVNSSTASSNPWGDQSNGGGIHQAYELREQIGKGSFATVHKGVQRSTGKLVAVKIIEKTRFQSNPKTMEMFAREVEIMKQLDHKFCVKCIDFFEDSRRIWLVLEYVDGGDLLDYVIRNKGLKEHETREIALMVCEAVSYLHSKGVAHRDLKPENLLLTKGSRPLCKVTDFGLAKMVGENTMLKTMCGTPTYLAPEVVLKNDANAGYGPAVDAWSIGIILYACLTNTTPFDESESTPLPQRMAERKVDMTSVREVGVSDMAIDFLSRLLINDPRRRMSVCDALRHPWLVTKVREDSAIMPLLVSSLPFNDKKPSYPTTDPNGNGGGGDSMIDSQGFERLRIQSSTPARTSMMSHTSPDRTTGDEHMTETAGTSVGADDSVNRSSIVRPAQVRFRKDESIVEAPSERELQESSVAVGEEPKSAFSSSSDVQVEQNGVEQRLGLQNGGRGSAMSLDEVKEPEEERMVEADVVTDARAEHATVTSDRHETPALSDAASSKRDRDGDDDDIERDQAPAAASAVASKARPNSGTPRRSGRRSSVISSASKATSASTRGTPRRAARASGAHAQAGLINTAATTVSTASESPEAQTPPPHDTEYAGMTTRRRAKVMRFC